MLQITNAIAIPDDEIDLTAIRSQGPGGQNVNKVSSKATLKWHIASASGVPQAVITRFLATYGSRLNKNGEVVISSDKYRDQSRNIEDCKDKLIAMISTVATPPKRRKPTKPSRGQKEARLQDKREKSEKKQRRGKIDH